MDNKPNNALPSWSDLMSSLLTSVKQHKNVKARTDAEDALYKMAAFVDSYTNKEGAK